MRRPATIKSRATLATAGVFSRIDLVRVPDRDVLRLVNMKPFACYVLSAGDRVARRARVEASTLVTRQWIIYGTIGGIVAAVAYDLFRLPFVLGGAPLFKPFAGFGELLLGAKRAKMADPIGWLGYHFSNGAALGIMFLAILWKPTASRLFWGAVVWALMVEALLLMTPYTNFFGIPFDRRFIILTASAHLVFGLVLGWWCMRRAALSRRASSFSKTRLTHATSASSDFALGSPWASTRSV